MLGRARETGSSEVEVEASIGKDMGKNESGIPMGISKDPRGSLLTTLLSTKEEGAVLVKKSKDGINLSLLLMLPLLLLLLLLLLL